MGWNDATWKHNPTCEMWSPDDGHFFPDLEIHHRMQDSGACVPTTLAMLAGAAPADFMGPHLNTQDPRTWSDALIPYGMKLAYVPCDVRQLAYYMEELIGLDDAFLLSYYLHDLHVSPSQDGKLGPSHIVLLYRDKIHDAMMGGPMEAMSHQCLRRHTKRIFRVVPSDHPRGL